MKDITISIGFSELNISATEIGEYIGETYCGDDFVDLINGIGKRIKSNDDFEWVYKAIIDEKNGLDCDGLWLMEKIKEVMSEE